MVESVEPPHTKTKLSMQTYEGSIKKEDKERDKIFISSMITHESDESMCLAMIVRTNLVIS
jgi:hypothetical protein